MTTINTWYTCQPKDRRTTQQTCGVCRKTETVQWEFGKYAQGMWCVVSSPFAGHEHGCGDFTHAACCRAAYPHGCVDGPRPPVPGHICNGEEWLCEYGHGNPDNAIYFCTEWMSWELGRKETDVCGSGA